MPGRGKHCRPRSNAFVRGVVAAGAGGAVIALPLVAATGAHAAVKTAPVVASANTASVAPMAGRHSAVSGPTTYSVVPGDYLARIAARQHVVGGWHRLYRDNRAAIGTNPSLIHPGLKLVIGAKARPQGRSHPAATGTAAATTGPAKPSSATTGTPVSLTKQVPESTGSGYTKPVDQYVLGTPYHLAGPLWASGYHTGVDFVVPSGTTVKAVAAGTVVTAGWGGSYGNQVVIRHSDGRYTQYAHMSVLSVSAGQKVGEGQQIGLSGATGNVTGPHLHFEARTGPDYGSDIDPVAYLRSHGVTV